MRRSLGRMAALALAAMVWLRFPAAGRGQAPPATGDPVALVRALGDPAERVRFRAMADLLRLGRSATRELVQALLDTRPIVENRELSRADFAFAVLLDAPGPSVDALLDAYRSAPPESPRLRGSGGVPPRERILVLLERWPLKPTERVHAALRSGDPALRAALAEALGRTGPAAARAVPWLVRVAAEDGPAKVRSAATDALSRIPESGARALRGLLGNRDPRVRSAALAAYPWDAEKAAELVARCLRDPEPEVRRTALLQIQEAIVHPRIVTLPDEPSGTDDDEPSAPEPSPLAGLPRSALADLAVLVRDGDPRIRRDAVEGLGSLARVRREAAADIADALAARISDPVPEVAAEALDQLAGLAELGVVPRTPGLLDELLHGLATPAEEGHRETLALLGRLRLPETRRDEVIAALVTACSTDFRGEDCHGAHEILLQRPAWLEAAVAALDARYPEVDDQALSALKVLGEWSAGLTRSLVRFLDHPDLTLRTEAAIALAGRGYDPGRLRGVLAEGARSFSGRLVRGNDAAPTLARLGEPGVARLVAILEDAATEREAHEAVLETLQAVAPRSPQVAGYLLAAAGSSRDPGARAAAIRALPSLASRRGEVAAVLAAAFASGDVQIRAAAAEAWAAAGQAPGEWVARVFADPSPEVRQRGFLLLARLAPGDPRRLSFTAAAVQDESRRVRDEALRFAVELGEPGAALFARYAASGGDLTEQFFDRADRLDSVGDALAEALDARAAAAPSWELDRIVELLGRAGAAVPEVRRRLHAELESGDPAARDSAALGLSTLREDPWAHDGRLATALMDLGARRVVEEKLAAALERLDQRDAVMGLQAISDNVSPRLPRIDWPPPAGFRPPVVVPRELLGATERTTLGDVYQRLVGSLEAVSHGFEHGLFLGPPGGFALVARMERVRPDGTPYPEPARWLEKGSPKLSLMDLLTDLFFENPGFFRIIVFAVTSDLVPGQDLRTVLPKPREGFPTMLDDLTGLPFKGKEILALVYSFERRGDAKVKPWEDGAPSALQHLERSGVWARLGTRR